MAIAASHTIRVATGLRSGYDQQQHRPETATTAVCGERIREERYDRPDWPRCLDCIEVKGIDVAPPTEGEQRAIWGDR